MHEDKQGVRPETHKELVEFSATSPKNRNIKAHRSHPSFDLDPGSILCRSHEYITNSFFARFERRTGSLYHGELFHHPLEILEIECQGECEHVQYRRPWHLDLHVVQTAYSRGLGNLRTLKYHENLGWHSIIDELRLVDLRTAMAQGAEQRNAQ